MNRLLEFSNSDLIMLYKHSMVRDYYTIRTLQGWYHPKYEHNAVNVPASPVLKNSFFYSTHSMSLLKEMWRRCNEGTFYEMAFWTSRGLFYTKISPLTVNEESVVESQANVDPEEKVKDVITFEGEDHVLIGQGSKRKAYVSKDRTYVIKVPMESTSLGIEENIAEAETYKKFPNSMYAKCELLENDWLKMEYVEPAALTKGGDCPDWVSKIAEGQVGYNNDGVLVAYDYGSEI